VWIVEIAAQVPVFRLVSAWGQGVAKGNCQADAGGLLEGQHPLHQLRAVLTIELQTKWCICVFLFIGCWLLLVLLVIDFVCACVGDPI